MEDFSNGVAPAVPLSEEEMRLRLDKLEAGHERITADLSEVRVLVAKSDGKLETLLQLSEARRADELERERLLHEARMEAIKLRPTMVKAIGTAIAAVIAASIYGILR
jgi:hypothetical protein